MTIERIKQAIRYTGAQFHNDAWHYTAPDGRLLQIDLAGLEHLGEALADRFIEWQDGYTIEGVGAPTLDDIDITAAKPTLDL